MLVGYARVSTVEQDAGFEAQERELKAAKRRAAVFRADERGRGRARRSMRQLTSFERATPSLSRN